MSHLQHELEEAAEHAAHAGGPGKQIALTMAMLGVLLAACAALVGSHRTMLIKAMVEQSNKYGVYQAETMKFRVIEASHEMLKSLTPKADEIAKIDATLRAKRRAGGKADDEDTAELKDLVASSTEDLADLLSPDAEETEKFAAIAHKYAADMREAKEDAAAYDGAVEAHQEAAERYEQAQLVAEIGIVIASVALLLGSRLVWGVSVALGLLGLGLVGTTWAHTSHALEVAERRIADAKANVAKIEADDADEGPAAGARGHAPPPAASGAKSHDAHAPHGHE